MELANIEQLVEKYLNAETTLQEEVILKDYFLSNNVAPHLQEYSYMFSYFEQNKDETYTKIIELKPKKSKKRNLQWVSVAASVVLLFSVFIGKQEYDKYQQRQQLNKLKETLQFVSYNLNRSNEAVEHLYTYENTVNKILNQVN